MNKIITAAAALETGAVSRRPTVPRPGARCRWAQFTIHDSHVHPVETMTLGDIIAQSSNIGRRDGGRPGRQRRLAAVHGPLRLRPARPGSGSPARRRAACRHPHWDDVIRATASYGQGVAVTPLQMADVYATIANGGGGCSRAWCVAPRAPRARSAPRRVAAPSAWSVPTRPRCSRGCSPRSCRTGPGSRPRSPGYQVAGKTGTARKLDANGTYIDRYMASFVGFLPAGDPRVVIAVSLDEPSTIYGGVAAAPLFSADRALRDPAAGHRGHCHPRAASAPARGRP